MAKLRTLSSKDGFTLVEMIVVIAIVAIMLGVFTMALSAKDAYITTARDFSKSFYYDMQETMTEERIANEYAISGYRVYEIHVDADGEVQSFTQSENGGAFADVDTSSNLYKSIKRLTWQTDRDGYYYARVDDKFRVVVSYWSEGDYSEITGQTFTEAYYIGGLLTGAYPIANCKQGEIVLV